MYIVDLCVWHALESMASARNRSKVCQGLIWFPRKQAYFKERQSRKVFREATENKQAAVEAGMWWVSARKGSKQLQARGVRLATHD